MRQKLIVSRGELNSYEIKPLSTPLFQSVANQLAAEMAQMDVDLLTRQLDCSRKLAVENWKRYQEFTCAETMPAILE